VTVFIDFIAASYSKEDFNSKSIKFLHIASNYLQSTSTNSEKSHVREAHTKGGVEERKK
jgi:hypothetical protein